MADALPVHVTVVIPTRNEEAAIVDTIRSVPNDGWCEKLDFLIIDGNSTEFLKDYRDLIGQVSDKPINPLWWATNTSAKNRSTSDLPKLLNQIGCLTNSLITFEKIVSDQVCRRAVVENVRFYGLKLQIAFSEALDNCIRNDPRLIEALQSL